MKFNENSLPNDPEQLKQMLLELQQRMERKLAEKYVAYQQFLERYNLKLANEYGKNSEKMPGDDEVFNEVEFVLDEHDKKLLAAQHADATTKTKPKSMAMHNLLSQIIACKYPFDLPLYRQETMFSDIGIKLSRQTMSIWMLRSAQF